MDKLLAEYSQESANVKIKKQDLSLIIKHLEEEVEILRQKNEEKQIKLDRLGLNDDNLSEDIKIFAEKLAKVQVNLESNADITNTYVSRGTEKRIFNKIVTKLKRDTTALKKSNQELRNDIVILEKELKDGEAEIDAIPSLINDEIKAIEMRIRDYESKLRSFEKYSWMTESHLNLKTIQHEINELKKLEEERNALLKQLNSYHGLKPSIAEATEQLLNLKKECDKFSALITTKK